MARYRENQGTVLRGAIGRNCSDGMSKNLMSEAKPLTSYSSYGGLSSKMWILPDGRVVSIGEQHYEWALRNAGRLRDEYGIDVARVRAQEDTPIRLYLLSKGCVRVNYEHRGGRLTLEANHRHWGRPQRTAYRAIVAENLNAISFVRVHLLNKFAKAVREGSAKLFTGSQAAKLRNLPLISPSPRRPSSRAGGTANANPAHC